MSQILRQAQFGLPTDGTGGSIPLVGLLTERLGVDCIITGFICADDAIHAPNEHFDLERLRKGTRSWVRIISAMCATEPADRRVILKSSNAAMMFFVGLGAVTARRPLSRE